MKNSSRLELKMAEEFHPLEQRHRWVFGLFQNPSIEFQPGEIPVNERTLLVRHNPQE
jgi:hypothetical protein